MSAIYPIFFVVARWITALLSLALVYFWIVYFKSNKQVTPIYAALTTKDGINLNISAKENVIGRGGLADIMIPLKNVEKKHALLFYKKGEWFLSPLDGKVGINLLNVTKAAPLEYGDKINIAGQTLTFVLKNSEDLSSKKPKGAGLPLLILTVFQIFVFLEIFLKYYSLKNPLIPLGFGAIILVQWVYYLIGKTNKNFKMVSEIPIFYLSTMGLALCCCSGWDQLLKNIVCYFAGFVFYIILTLMLKLKEFLLVMQRALMVLSLAILYYTAFFGVKINSARNWLEIGPISFQPSEIIKVAFVIVSATTLYIIFKKPARMWEFIGFSLLSMGALAIMMDFGAVAIFFAGMLIVLALRLTNPLIIGAISGLAVIGATGVILIYPYIARRFGAWLNAWQYADTSGYQQTRTMMATASGGLLGVGAGEGKLQYVSASQTDLVFGIVAEEWGGIIALVVALCFVALGIYAYRLIKSGDCVFYSIMVGAATVMIIFQTALNIFGSLDLLPLTGVTMIFVSRGGTSLIAAWLMLSFFKASELYKNKL